MADVSNGLRLIVVHLSKGNYLAFNMSCTHQGADIEFMKDKTGSFVPCITHIQFEG